jgi:C4-dicarboxylate transporter DctM subunit
MVGYEVALVTLLAMLILIYLGMYVPIVLALLSFVGVVLIRGDVNVAINLLVQTASKGIQDFLFGAIPLFVLMGALVGVADLGRDAYQVANVAFRRLRGALGIATVAANALFVAIHGSSIASASIFSRIAVPAMLTYDYNRRFAVGVVCGSSVLGMLIPPSVLLIVYAVLAEQSVGDMFIAGILPGLVLAAVFCIGILGAGYLWPDLVQSLEARRMHTDTAEDLTRRQIVEKLVPLVVLSGILVVGIYGGVYTPTEAGAAGAFAALIVTLWRRKLTLASFWRILVETGHITAAILFLVISGMMYSRMLAMSGLPSQISEWVMGMNAGFALLITWYVILMLFLGTLMDAISVMLITVPLFIGVLRPFGIDLVWFGIVTTIGVEIGMIHPPMGISAFVVKASLHEYRFTLWDIYMGAWPFAIAMLLVLALVIVVPEISTILVRR